jgi:hypothetical protein
MTTRWRSLALSACILPAIINFFHKSAEPERLNSGRATRRLHNRYFSTFHFTFQVNWKWNDGYIRYSTEMEWNGGESLVEFHSSWTRFDGISILRLSENQRNFQVLPREFQLPSRNPYSASNHSHHTSTMFTSIVRATAGVLGRTASVRSLPALSRLGGVRFSHGHEETDDEFDARMSTTSHFTLLSDLRNNESIFSLQE